MGALLKFIGLATVLFLTFLRSSSGFSVFLIWKSRIASGSIVHRAATFSNTLVLVFFSGEIDLVLRRICWSLVGEGGSRFRLRPIHLFLKGKEFWRGEGGVSK